MKTAPYTESQIIQWQRAFRHKRYLKRNQGKGDEYITPLHIKHLDSVQRNSLSEVIRQWKKHSNTSKCDCEIIYVSMAYRIQKQYEQALGIFDRNETLQGCMLYKLEKTHLEIVYLATAPTNLGKEGIRGAGTALIERALHIASTHFNQGPILKLESDISANPFYTSLGFLRDPAAFPEENRFFLTERDRFLNAFAGRAFYTDPVKIN